MIVGPTIRKVRRGIDVVSTAVYAHGERIRTLACGGDGVRVVHRVMAVIHNYSRRNCDGQAIFGAVLTTLSFLSQALRIRRRRSADDVSFTKYLIVTSPARR
jgi:hypothetical protein